jgi:hypothetical protein
MSVVGWYCKAYEVEAFRAYPGWADVLAAHESKNGPIEEDAVLFLHQDLAVTTGAIREEGVIAEQVTDEWRTFCAETLAFSIPEYMQEVEAAG